MSKLPMRDDEIANSYRLAKDPEAQVTVLAELNATTPENIKRILVERAVYVPGNGKPKKQRAQSHPWTKDDNRELLRMADAGASYREIAVKLGRSSGAVSVQLTKLRKSGGGRKWNPKRRPYSRKKNLLQNGRILSCGVSRAA